MATRAVNLAAPNRKESPTMSTLLPLKKKQVILFGASIALLAALSAAGVAVSAHRDSPVAATSSGAASAPAATAWAVTQQPAFTFEESLDWNRVDLNRVEETHSDGGYTYWAEHRGARSGAR
jgi:hypothetical protein